MSDRLRKLSELAQMIKETELTRLSAAEAERQKIRHEADALRLARRAALASCGPDLSHLGGGAARWQDWCADRLIRLAAAEALAAADAETQKRIAARAFGRSIALDRLAEQAALAKKPK